MGEQRYANIAIYIFTYGYISNYNISLRLFTKKNSVPRLVMRPKSQVPLNKVTLFNFCLDDQASEFLSQGKTLASYGVNISNKIYECCDCDFFHIF